MTSVTKPPVRLKLSSKDAECHRLVRLLMRAYYDKEHVAVIDCLLDMQVKQANKVTESDLSSELHLSPKLVREILHRLRQDQIVRGVQKSEAAPKVEELTSKGRKKNYTRAPTVTFQWFVDFDQLVNVIKFRHWDIFEKLNKKVDRSEVFYICPTPHCENHSPQRKRSVMDLLLDQRTAGAADGIFRCEVCFTIDTLTNTKHATPLVLLTHQEASSAAAAAAAAAGGSASSAAAAAASSSVLPLGVDPSENLKNKFNKQLGVILEQLMKVDRMLQEDVAAKKEQVAAGILPTGSAAAAGGASSAAAASGADQKGGIDFSQANAVASMHAAAAAAAAASGSATAGSAGLSSMQSVEDMISVSLSSGSEGPAAKRVKMENVISNMNRDALPWDKNAPLSLAKVEEEKAAQQHARSLAAEQEQQRKEAAEKERFQKEYKEQLAKAQQAAAAAAALHERETQAAAAAAAAAAASAQHAYPQQPTHDMQTDEQSMLLGGRHVPVSSITQEDIDQMSSEEFDQYSALAGSHEEF